MPPEPAAPPAPDPLDAPAVPTAPVAPLLAANAACGAWAAAPRSRAAIRTAGLLPMNRRWNFAFLLEAAMADFDEMKNLDASLCA